MIVRCFEILKFFAKGMRFDVPMIPAADRHAAGGAKWCHEQEKHCRAANCGSERASWQNG